VIIDRGCFRQIDAGVRVANLEPRSVEARLDALEIDNAQRAVAIERLFREAGCADLRTERFEGSDLPNVICTLPGIPGARMLVVGAHYDRAEKGQGAVDNWTGASLLPSLYQSLAALERVHTIQLIAFGAEEAGLLGSKAHVQALDESARAQRIAMVNLDTLGLGSEKIDFRTSDPLLTCFMVAAQSLARVPTELASVTRVGTSDYEPFRAAGIRVISIHSLSTKTLPILHTESDTLERVDRAAYYRSYRVISTYLALLDRYLAGGPEPSAPQS
jgi:hypothetical protein